MTMFMIKNLKFQDKKYTIYIEIEIFWFTITHF